MFSAENWRRLGTNVFVYLKGEGCLQEPSVIAYHRGTNRVLAVGRSPQMIGRTRGCGGISLRGVVADYQVAQIMLQHFRQAAPGRFRPSASTDVERRAVVSGQAGAKSS